MAYIRTDNAAAAVHLLYCSTAVPQLLCSAHARAIKVLQSDGSHTDDKEILISDLHLWRKIGVVVGLSRRPRALASNIAVDSGARQFMQKHAELPFIVTRVLLTAPLPLPFRCDPLVMLVAMLVASCTMRTDISATRLDNERFAVHADSVHSIKEP